MANTTERWLASRRKRGRDIRDFIPVHGKIIKPSSTSPPQAQRLSGEEKALKKKKQSQLSRLQKEEEERRRLGNKVSASAFTAGVRRKAPLRELEDNLMASLPGETDEEEEKPVLEKNKIRRRGKENDFDFSPERLVVNESVFNTPLTTPRPRHVNASTLSALPPITMETASPSVLGPPPANLRHDAPTPSFLRPSITMGTSSPGELFSWEEEEKEEEEETSEDHPEDSVMATPPSLPSSSSSLFKMNSKDLLSEVDYCIVMCDKVLSEV